jgi:hypothetical protein
VKGGKPQEPSVEVSPGVQRWELELELLLEELERYREQLSAGLLAELLGLLGL